jgi:hypothetical protein
LASEKHFKKFEKGYVVTTDDLHNTLSSHLRMNAARGMQPVLEQVSGKALVTRGVAAASLHCCEGVGQLLAENWHSYGQLQGHHAVRQLQPNGHHSLI